MSIRPVDLQVMLPRTAEITRNQANEGSRPDVAQHQFAQQLNKEAANNMQTVVNTNRSDEKQRVNDDESKNNKRGKQKRKQGGNDKNGASADKRTSSGNRSDGGSLIDISI